MDEFGNFNSFITMIDEEDTQEQNNTYNHVLFRDIWLKKGLPQTVINESDLIKYDGREIYVVEDLGPFLEKIENAGGSQAQCRKLFEEEYKNDDNNYKRVILRADTGFNNGDKYAWYNSTIKKINLRPGIIESDLYHIPPAVPMVNDAVHGVIVGSTGSGKSVFLNNILLNLMLEYPAWELELYLADFKKVEMSKYMSVENGKSPHVAACAATSEIRYVLSLIESIKKKMEQREVFLAKLGYKNIIDFRKSKMFENVVIPRILLVVDEFQQMFIDAKGRQNQMITDALTAITRKGRATGVHLLFASQNMSGTGIDLPNFKIRFALGCDKEVSTSILGNSRASDLQVGQVILNMKSNNAEDNQIYKVPFASDEVPGEDADAKSYFDKLLIEIASLANVYNYTYLDKQKFYNENEQKEIAELERLELNKKLLLNRMAMSNCWCGPYYLSMLLGREVIYNRKEYDIENTILEYGKSKNILNISTDAGDLAYLQNLYAINFKTAPFTCCRDELEKDPEKVLVSMSGCKHIYYDFNPIVSSMYDIRKDLVLTPNSSEIDKKLLKDVEVGYRNRIDDIRGVLNIFYIRKQALTYLQSNMPVSNYCLQMLRYQSILAPKFGEIMSSEQGNRLIEEILADVESYNRSDDIITLAKKLKNLEQDPLTPPLKKTFLSIVRERVSEYYRYHNLFYTDAVTKERKRILPYKIFKPYVLWFNGTENLGTEMDKYINIDKREFTSIGASPISGTLGDLFKNCMDVNIFCIYFNAAEVEPFINRSSNIVIVGGRDDSLYEKYVGYLTARSIGNIALEGRNKSTSRQFAFKKYKTAYIGTYRNSINLDSILSE